MTRQQMKTLKECVKATRRHIEVLRNIAFPSPDILDVIEGLEITATKLELVNPAPRKRVAHRYNPDTDECVWCGADLQDCGTCPGGEVDLQVVPRGA